MHGQHVEEDSVARFKRPPNDRPPLGIGVKVRDFSEAALREPSGPVVKEGPRHIPGSTVGAGNKANGGRPVHWVDGEPHAGILMAVHVVVRKILMPTGVLSGSRLLHQDVVVVQTHGARLRQGGGDPCSRRLADELFHLWDPVPVAEILDEGPVVMGAGPLGQWREVGQVGLDGLRGPTKVFVAEGLANTDRAVSPVVTLKDHRSDGPFVSSSSGPKSPTDAAPTRAMVRSVPNRSNSSTWSTPASPAAARA